MKETLKVLLLLLVVFAILETLCFFVIKGFFSKTDSYPYNRIISGTSLYYNTPGYDYSASTIKKAPSENNLVIDSNGFVSNHTISFEKPAGTLRVFLMGGSAMFGSGQSKPYDQKKKYPAGNYSWEASIAGCLQKTLDSICPGQKFEVINASCSGFTTEQSMFLYLEKICRFSPDFIIEMDGMNDMGNMIMGKQANFNNATFNSYLELATRYKNIPSFNMLKLTYLIQSEILQRKSDQLSEQIMLSKLNFNPAAYSLSQYQRVASILQDNVHDYLKIIDRYNAALRTDSVKFIFVLQPLLNRRIVNKELSPDETRFAQEVDPITLPEKKINAYLDKKLASSGISNYDVVHLFLFYHFDYGFADSIKTTVEKHKNVFIDGNRAIQDLGKGVEFFTDYCHLTPQGNQYMAGLFARQIKTEIEASQKPEKH